LAQDETIDSNERRIYMKDFIFDKDTGTIKKYKGEGGIVEIPSEIDGVNVISIGDEVFAHCSGKVHFLNLKEYINKITI
jgi:hypothetical protein